jgi:hypothetical protein
MGLARKLGLYLDSEVDGLLERVPGPYFGREAVIESYTLFWLSPMFELTCLILFLATSFIIAGF